MIINFSYYLLKKKIEILIIFLTSLLIIFNNSASMKKSYSELQRTFYRTMALTTIEEVFILNFKNLIMFKL
jgi:hypothetical protein